MLTTSSLPATALRQPIVSRYSGDLLSVMQLAAIHPWTLLGRIIPIFARSNDSSPERPRTTLFGSLFIDRATRSTLIKNTVAAALFQQRSPLFTLSPNQTRVPRAKGLSIHAEAHAEGIRFVFAYPSKTRGTRTTIAALRTRKTQAFSVPW
jgi:hypothetical protein